MHNLYLIADKSWCSLLAVELIEKIKSFPTKSGVYLFKDKKGDVIYVGKAKNLRSRVRQYFMKHDERAQVEFLVKRAIDVEYIITDNEKEALLLENTLIKKYRPRYNIFLRDDKSYPSIRIGMEHPSPGIRMTRRVVKDGAQYFGPFASSASCREMYEQVIICCKIRSCSDNVFANRMRPCLEYDLGRCTAPCVNLISKDDYKKQLTDAIAILKGAKKDIQRRLKIEMKRASDAQDFEAAARFRDALSRMDEALEKQKVVGHGLGDADYIGIYEAEKKLVFVVLTVQAGLLTGKKEYLIMEISDKISEVMTSFIIQFYFGGTIPPHIHTSHAPDRAKALKAILSDNAHHSVSISQPKIGYKKELVELAIKNAREYYDRKIKDVIAYDELGKRLQKKLELPNVPNLIECLDISNIQGKDAYGSLISFEYGEPNKLKYRLYSIRSVMEPNDYAMMEEVLNRRFHEGKNTLSPPDLLLLDGGKGQLNIAKRVFDTLGLDLPIAAIAKGKDGRQDEVYLPNRKNPVTLKRGTKELLFMMRVRDETHRFGIKAHRKKHQKGIYK
ncbi:MAG: excinuclease ABC subunit UvrC [Pseudomonadota bacterium]